MPLTRAALDEILADIGLPVAAEQHPVGQDDRALALALERGDEVQQESVVAVFGRGNAVGEAPKAVVGRVEAVGPCLVGEGRIGDGEIEGPEAAVRVREVGGGQRVAVPQVGGFVAVQDHVHAAPAPKWRCLSPGRYTGDAARRPVGGLEQQRAGTAGRIVNRLFPSVSAPTPITWAMMRETSAGCRTAPCSCPTRWRSAASGTRRASPSRSSPSARLAWKSSGVEYGDQLGEPVLHLLARAEPALGR